MIKPTAKRLRQRKLARKRYATDPRVREKAIAYARKWARRNPTTRAEGQRRWREANKEYLRAKKREWAERNVARVLWLSARYRSRKAGARFDLEPTDVVVPDRCPVLGIKLARRKAKKRTWRTPSLDRIDHVKGYVKGNVRVISWRANWLKADATCAELQAVLNYVKEKHGK